MPYIPQDQKLLLGTKHYYPVELADFLMEKFQPIEIPGIINWFNFLIIKRITESQKGFKRYWFFAVWVGTMICCVLEVYRKLVAPYEDEKEKENPL